MNAQQPLTHPSFPCIYGDPECRNRVFAQLSRMKEHVLEHLQLFQCNVCMKRFGRRFNFTRHDEQNCLRERVDEPLTVVDHERHRRICAARTYQEVREAASTDWEEDFLARLQQPQQPPNFLRLPPPTTVLPSQNTPAPAYQPQPLQNNLIPTVTWQQHEQTPQEGVDQQLGFQELLYREMNEREIEERIASRNF